MERNQQPASVGQAGTPSSRRALLEAVGEVLHEQGLEGLSLRKVAARAGLSHAAPGVLFGGRAAMLTAYASGGFQELGRRMHAAEQAAGDAVKALAGTGQAYVKFAIEEPLRFQVMFRTDRLLPRDPEYVKACRDAFIPLQRAIERGMEAGWVHKGNAADITVTAWSLVHGLAMLWFSKHLAGRINPEPEALTRRVTELFAGAIMVRGTQAETRAPAERARAGAAAEEDPRPRPDATDAPGDTTAQDQAVPRPDAVPRPESIAGPEGLPPAEAISVG